MPGAYKPNDKEIEDADHLRRRGKIGFTGHFRKILAKYDDNTHVTNYECIAEKAVNLLKSKTIASRDFITLLSYITDRLEGKAVSLEVVGHLNNESPLAHLDTDVLIERLHRIKDQKKKAEITTDHAPDKSDG